MVVGLGSDADVKTAQIVPQVLSTAGTVGTSVAVSTGALTAGSLAIPLIGAAVAGATLVIGMWLSSIAKHNAEKAATTKIVDEAEGYLRQNRDAYLSGAIHTQADKDQALGNFDAIWQQVVNACSSGAYEDAGRRCVQDRQRGGKWDWFSYYRDPIASTSVASAQQAVGIDASRYVANLSQSTGFSEEVIIWGGATIAALILIKLMK